MTDDEAVFAQWPLVGRVEIVRRISPDGDLTDSVIAEDADGDELMLSEALGMMWLGGDTLIRQRMDEAE